jgi:hypothetical protein
MLYPHRIRLVGPWEYEPLARADGQPLPPGGRMTMPVRWQESGLTDFAGRVRFVRRFGYPGQIDDFERVWITFAGFTGRAAVSVNGEPLATDCMGESGCAFEVTRLLKFRNELTVDLEAGPDGGLWGEVALEVRRTAFLRDVAWSLELADAGVVLVVSGVVEGTASGLLELYVVLDRRNVAYATLTTSAEGVPFVLRSEPLADAPSAESAVCVDLVEGATVWYRVEGGIGS